MTVQELIDALSAVEDKSRMVLVEGCDCINPAKGLDLTPDLSPVYDPEPVLVEAAL